MTIADLVPGPFRRERRPPTDGFAPSRRRLLALLGPAFVASIAYVDPGNFATNTAAGASAGYALAWVVVAASGLAMLIQTLSGKLGLATGHNLPELCRLHFPRPVSLGLWVQAEIVAMATDLAEVLGGAVALNLLFGVPPVAGGVLTAAVAMALLTLSGRRQRTFEYVVGGMLLTILAGFAYNLVLVRPDAAGVARGLVPDLPGDDAFVLATGILGATVMPHVIYLHGALTQQRGEARPDVRRYLRAHRIDVLVAMSVAGLVNLGMLVLAGRLFHGSVLPDLDTLEGAHAALGRLLDAPAATAFALALLASGFASAGVGTYAGQVVMEGFLRRRAPLLARRLLTLVPALVVLVLGIDATRALVVSQVVLSFGIPFALVPLVLLGRRRDVMGDLADARGTTVAAAVASALVVVLNGLLLVRLVTG
ncbi:MAG TPA: Nramp family divalent metal transporter [Kineosporiaceae bacterium]|nr:Nramp family divalent metal transporter [Kineosporiaceae bacterium]